MPLEVLGRGEFGIVLRAFDEIMVRVVAVKVLTPATAATSPPASDSSARRAYAAVRHEHVVQVFKQEAGAGAERVKLAAVSL